MPIIARAVAGAGTGKTRFLMNTMQLVIEEGRYGPNDIGLGTFTTAAAREARERAAKLFGVEDEELTYFSTIHSIAFRHLQKRGKLLADNAESRKWLTEALGDDMGQSTADADGLGIVIGAATSDSARALAIWSTARNRLVPYREVWDVAYAQSDRTPEYERCRQIVTRYEMKKNLDNRFDFTDMIGRYAGRKFHLDGHSEVEPEGEVPDISVWLLDEQQDNTALLNLCLLRLIGAPSCRWVYVVADPFQCQLPGTKVHTDSGDKNIEDLDPLTDKIIAYCRKDGRYYGHGKAIKFRIAKRVASAADVLKISTDVGEATNSTVNHFWLAKLTRKPKFVTYLMQRNDRFRVGTCKLTTANPGKNGTMRLGQRSRIEEAERSWILKAFDTDKEARIYEQIVSYKFGIPQTVFRPIKQKGCNLDDSYIEAVFTPLEKHMNLHLQAHRCLRAHGRDILYPFWQSKDGRRHGQDVATKTAACNLVAGLHLLPRVTGTMESDKPDWVEIASIERCADRDTPVTVYSLDVEKWHTYISDGYVTHNSIYGWAGADGSLFMQWPVAKEKILTKSYRCGAPIIALGEAILSELSHGYFNRGIEPADHDSEIIHSNTTDEILSMVDPRESWLLLARTNWHAQRFAAYLQANGIPWVPTKGMGGWNAPKRLLGLAAMVQLKDGWPITAAEWQAILGQIASNHGVIPLLERGTKAKWGRTDFQEPDDIVGLDQLHTWGATPEFVHLIRSGAWPQVVDHGREFQGAVNQWGMDATCKPGIQVGTIHSVKGAEADNVALLTTTSQLVEAANDTEEGADESRRVAYVAVTRARRKLFVIREPRMKWRMELPC